MCLYILKSEEEKNEWLKKQKETIVAYKSVRKDGGKYYPSCYHHGHGGESFFSRRMNRIKGDRIAQTTYWGNKGSYKPFYHLFKHKTHAKNWMCLCETVKCEIPKKDVTAIGSQDGEFVIVTKAFKIIKEVK